MSDRYLEAEELSSSAKDDLPIGVTVGSSETRFVCAVNRVTGRISQSDQVHRVVLNTETLSCNQENASAGTWDLYIEGVRWTRAEYEQVRGWAKSRPEAGRSQDLAIPARINALGVTAMAPVPGDADLVRIGSMSSIVAVRGFSSELLRVCQSNAQKLLEARPRPTHLLVAVAFLMGSRDADRTLSPPSIEEVAGIDYVWVMHQGHHPEDVRPTVWWAQPGDMTWNTSLRRHQISSRSRASVAIFLAMSSASSGPI